MHMCQGVPGWRVRCTHVSVSTWVEGKICTCVSDYLVVGEICTCVSDYLVVGEICTCVGECLGGG